MQRSTITPMTAFLLGVWLLAAPSAAEQPYAAHRIIGIKSLDVLPADIAPLFRKHSAEFLDRILQPGIDWPHEKFGRGRNGWHFFAGDLEAATPTQSDRIEALRAFPRDRAGAGRLYRRHGHNPAGVLPWAIEECFQLCVEAFEHGDVGDVIERSGHLAHFAGDVVNPFRLSRDNGGASVGNLTFGTSRGVHPTIAYASVRLRVGVGLFAHFAPEFSNSIAVDTSRYQPVRDPVARTFSRIEDAYAVLDNMAVADRQVIAALKIRDRRSFAEHEADYYKAMGDRCGEICVRRLESCAVFAANLIGGAWQAAGEPTIEAIRSRSDDDLTSSRSAAFLGDVAYVGSRRSNIFHKPNCPFARKINEDNLVTFSTALQARQARRRACKLCKPK